MAFMERIVFVHGSVMGGRPTWNAQRVLDDRFELDIWERPGFAPNPPVEQVDFDVDAVALCERLLAGSHVVGHSAGGVVALLAAARART
jgi:pimeloyl-ACP methyl ester carboxylesterase